MLPFDGGDLLLLLLLLPFTLSDSHSWFPPWGENQVKNETFQHFMADNGKCAVGIILIARTRSLGAVSNFLYFRAGDPESKVKENQREQNAAALRVSSSREEILKRIS